jgi:hypothetical protein
MRWSRLSIWYRAPFVAILISLLVCSCSLSVAPISFADDKRAARNLIKTVHDLYNEQKYGEMFGRFTENGRLSSNPANFARQFETLYADVGKVKVSKLLREDVTMQGNARFVHLIYRTEYERSVKFEEYECIVLENSVLIDFYGNPDTVPGAN